nr:non-ribosomal peptide synthetase [Paenibacillus sp. ISL-20]
MIVQANENENYPIHTITAVPGGSDSYPVRVIVALDAIHDLELVTPSEFDAVFNFHRNGDSLSLSVFYSANKYRFETIQSLSVYLLRYLELIAHNLNTKIELIELLSDAEKQQLLDEFNDTEAAYPETTIHRLFEEQAQRSPEQTAIVFEEQRLTYRELNARANQIARYLRKMGVVQDQTVAIVMERSLEMIVGILGILKAGAAYLPIDPEYPADRIAFMLEDSSSDCVVIQSHLSKCIPKTYTGKILDLNSGEFHIEDEANPDYECALTSLAYVIYTSGTTGNPKGVMIEHRNISNTLQWRREMYGLACSDTVVVATPFVFDAFVTSMFTTLISGASAVLTEINEFINRLNHGGAEGTEGTEITHFIGTPSMYSLMLEHALPKRLEGLKQVTLGGEPLSNNLIDKTARILPQAEIINEYGPTENSVVATVYRVEQGKQSIRTIGKPISNTKIYIVDESNRLKPVGFSGELCIAGMGVARGYLNNSELTASKFVASPFGAEERMYRTGDLARWMPDGNIEFLGRVDHQVKIRGYRIELGEIEAQLLRNEGIREAVVTAREDESGTGYLCAYVVSETEMTADELRQQAGEGVPEYMIPSVFVRLAEIPLTKNGKVDRKALPEPDDSIKSGAAYVSPRNETEERLLIIWQSVLQADLIGMMDNFFALGGHSLKATTLVARISQAFGVEIPLREVFQRPTIAEMADYMGAAEKKQQQRIAPALPQVYYPATSAQRRLFVLQQFDPGNTHYNISNALQMKGRLDRGRLEKAMQALIDRHEVLRTSIETSEGEIIQRIHETVDFQVEYEEADENEIEARITAFVRPFDLGKAPLLRVGVIQVAEEKHMLLFDMHHIISDGVSANVIARELSALYAGEALPELAIQYKDYAVWQQEHAASEAMKQQEAYWLNLYAEGVPVLNLPTDYARPVMQSFAGDRVRSRVSKEVTEGLHRVAKASGSTLYMVLLSAYSALLGKYSGQEDVVIGTPIAGRTHADVEEMVGMFVNTLVLRSRPAPDKPFTELLAEVKEAALDAYEHQDYPFEELVDRLNLPRDTGRNAVYDAMFVLQNMDMQALEMGDFELGAYADSAGTAKCDITLTAIEEDEEIELELEYGSALFRKETIERMSGHLLALLKAIGERPAAGIGSLEMLTEEEKQTLLHDFNATEAAYPKEKTIHQLFEEQVLRTPAQTAVVFESAELTYEELNARANQVARQLRSKGVGRDRIVGIMVERSAEMLVGILGILKAGGAYLPIDPEYPADRIAYMLEDSGTTWLVTQGSLRGQIPSAFGGEVIDLHSEALYGGETSNPNYACEPDSLAYVIYTSGTTGQPKGVMIEHAQISNTLQWRRDEYALQSFHNILQLFSFAFDGFVTSLFTPILSGSKVVLIQEELARDPMAIKRLILKEKITHFICIPSLYRSLLEIMTTVESEHLVQVTLAGEPLTESVLNLSFEKFPSVKIMNEYGPTENSVVATYKAVTDLTHIGIIGKPVANAQIYVLDRLSDRMQPIGVPGELCIAGSSLARGYLNNSKLTSSKFVANPFASGERMYRTGDLARWMPDGNIEFLGRIDHQVKIRGYRIELGEVEAQLLKHEQIREAVVSAREDESGAKYLCAYLVSEEELTIAELRQHMGAGLPEYMIPGAFVQLAEIPLTPNGKVDRKALPEPDGSMKSGVAYVAPRNKAEERLLVIWQSILQADTIGVMDNFFALGGHSLKATTLVARISQEFGAEMPLREVFQRPTIAGMAAYMKAADIKQQLRIAPAAPQAYYPATSAQRRLFVLQQFDPENVSYHIPAIFVVRGSLDPGRLNRAARLLVDRHEALRTSIETVEGEIVQRIHETADFQVEYGEAEEDEIEARVKSFVRPFDLEKGPLLRVGVIQVAAEKHVLLFDMHHIISDGVSVNVIARELSALYAGKELPELAIQYKDYAVWQQQQHAASEEMKRQEAYWLNLYADGVPVLNLPTDYARPVMQSFEGDWVRARVPKEVAAGLRHLAQASGSTLYMVLLSAYSVLLGKYSGQEELVIGTPIAGRTHADVEEMVGMFVNTLVLRSRPAPDKRFTDLLTEIKEASLGAYEHQDYPFEELVDRLNLPRDMGRNPVYDTMFMFQNMDLQALEIDGANLSPFEIAGQVAKCDLTLIAREEDEEIELQLDFGSKLFQKETIERMIGHLLELLRAVQETPETILSDLEILSASERHTLLQSFNDNEAAYPKEKTIHQLFEEQVLRSPKQTAVVFESAQLTYEELNARANQIARQLQAKGVGCDQIVGIMVERSLEMIVGILGVLKAGGTYLPIDPEYPADRIAYMLDDSGAAWLVTQGNLNGQIPDTFRGEVIDLRQEAVYAGETANPNYACEPGNLAYVIYTSGTTGRPKGVMIEHASLVNFIHAIDQVLENEDIHSFLQMTNITFDISVLEILCSLSRGKKVVVSFDGYNLDRLVLKQDRKSIDFSVFFFSTYQGDHNNYDLLLECAKYADENNYKAIWTPERHFHEFGGLFPNPAVTSAALAMTTHSIQIRSGSVVSPLHSSIRIAEEWSMVDNLSKGRIGVSFASGWHANDYVLNPGNYEKRKEMMFDQIEEVRKLWNKEAYTAPNGLGDVTSVEIYPKPVQKQLPVWVTTAGNEETYIKAGAAGANILTHLLGQDLGVLRKNIAAYRKSLKANGFDPLSGIVTLMVHTFIDEDLDRAKEKVRTPFYSYLKSSAGLISSLFPEESHSDAADNELYELAFEMFWESSTLFGNAEKCEKLVEEFISAGVNEVACLVDFGLDVQSIKEGLRHLTELRNHYADLVETGEKDMPAGPVDAMQCTPSKLVMLNEDMESKAFMKDLKAILVGGEPLPRELVRKTREFTDATIYNMYGPTETTVWSSSYKITEDNKVYIGKPLLNNYVYILNDRLSLLPIGQIGEIHIGGAGLARGYWNNPDLTAMKFIENPFRPGEKMYKTGDLARWLPGGNIEFLGRIDHQVKIRGYRIELGEIEAQLLRHPQIREAVVSALEELEGTKYLCAYIVTESKLTVTELRNYMGEMLPEYMIPSYFVRLSEMPLTSNGKVDRKLLPPPDGSLQSETSYVAPRNEVEERLSDIWKSILKVDTIGVFDHFFEHGGHSLKATTLVTRITQEFGIKIPLREMFLRPTIAGLAEYMAVAEKKEQSAILRTEQKAYYPATSAQRRLFVLHQLDLESTSYNEPKVFLLEGSLNRQRFEEAFLALINRHEILRTSLEALDGDVVQKIHEIKTFQIGFREAAESEVDGLIRAFIRPFDLSQPPLLRVELIKCSQDKYVLLLDIHHIISDGVSRDIIIRDILAIYAGESLPEVRVQYKDYAVWQQTAAIAEMMKKQEEYWMSVYSGGVPTLELTTDYARPAVQNFEGSRMRTVVSKDLTDGLNRLAKESGCTLYMVLLSVYGTLLGKYAGQGDISIGTPIAGRNHADVEEMIGMFVNTLVLRVRPEQEKTFEQLLKEVKEMALAAYENQDYPFEELVEKLKLPRDVSRNPLFDVMFVLQNTDTGALSTNADLDGVHVSEYEMTQQTAKFDLSLEIAEEEEQLVINLVYRSTLFMQQTIEQMLANYVKILEFITSESDLNIQLSEIKIGNDISKVKNVMPIDSEFVF